MSHGKRPKRPASRPWLWSCLTAGSSPARHPPCSDRSAAVIINAIKALGGISKETQLIEPAYVKPIQDLKINNLGNHNPRLHSDELLIALAITAKSNEHAAQAMAQLNNLRGAEAHSHRDPAGGRRQRLPQARHQRDLRSELPVQEALSSEIRKQPSGIRRVFFSSNQCPRGCRSPF